MTCDLLIIGGGPAGASAAITAARAGARVVLLERGRFPRHKVCGEFVSSESLELLAALLDSGHSALLRDATRILQARLFLDGRVLRTVIQPPAASIARLDLDAALWDAAISAGVEARQQTTVQSLAGSGPFQLATSAGEFEARTVIDASGRWSNLNASPNGTQRKKWLGVKAHFAEASPNPSVDLYFFDGGYCGVQPVKLEKAGSSGRVNACAMVRAEVASTLPDIFARHPELHQRSRHWQQLSEPVTTSPLIFRDPRPEREGALMVGDAAGFVDPFVGDGISLALRSGTMAAQCLIPFFRAEVTLREAVASYRQSYQERLAPIFRASSRIRRMLVLPRVLRGPLLFLLQNNPALTRYVVSKTR
ncbi:MAG: FAD-dependent monooxygenase [Acidobacteriia bacterium]|nr:FAD-dependent monooxygenase [Terriglobia bacterium]